MNTAPERDEEGNPRVSPFAVPLLLLGLIIGFFAGYFFLWWGLLAVAGVAVAALSAVLIGRSRDAAGALVLGAVGGWLMVLALAVFRGVI